MYKNTINTTKYNFFGTNILVIKYIFNTKKG